MANKSMMFRGPLKNFHLLGEDRKRSRYSMVNQAMHTASTCASCGLSVGWPNSSVSCSSGRVFRDKAMVDSTMKRMEMIARIWETERKIQLKMLKKTKNCQKKMICND